MSATKQSAENVSHIRVKYFGGQETEVLLEDFKNTVLKNLVNDTIDTALESSQAYGAIEVTDTTSETVINFDGASISVVIPPGGYATVAERAAAITDAFDGIDTVTASNAPWPGWEYVYLTIVEPGTAGNSVELSSESTGITIIPFTSGTDAPSAMDAKADATNAAINELIVEDPDLSREAMGAKGSFDLSFLNLTNTLARISSTNADNNDGYVSPITVAIWGDSLASGLSNPFPNRRHVGYKLMPIGWGQDTVGTVTTEIDTTAWLSGQYLRYADGSSETWKYNGSTEWEANKCGVGYITGPNGGVIQLEFSKNSGSTWTVLGSVDTYNATVGGGYTSFDISNQWRGPILMRVSNISGDGKDVQVVGCGLWIDGDSGVVLAQMNLYGINFVDLVNVPAATISGVIGDMEPDLLLTCFADAVSNFETGDSYDQIKAKWDAGYALTDWVPIGANPMNTESEDVQADPVLQMKALRAWATANNQSFIDGYTIFRSYEESCEIGWNSGDDHHLADDGRARRNRYIQSLFGAMLSPNDKTDISKKARLTQDGTTNGKVELESAATPGAGTAGMRIRGGTATTSFILGGRQTASNADALEMIVDGEVANGRSLMFNEPALGQPFIGWESTGNTATGRNTMSSQTPLSIDFKGRTDTYQEIGAPAARTSRTFSRVNSTTGKVEFCVKFPTGDAVVVATEP